MSGLKVVKGIVACLALAGCSSSWTVAYDDVTASKSPSNWHVHNVVVTVPGTLTQSDVNSFAPDADIVWHGELNGDRRTQVARIVRDGIFQGTRDLNGPRGVEIAVTLRHFHAVTPRAVSRAPGAVHNISYDIQVFDDITGEPITEQESISADLEAMVGHAAVVSAIEGRTQKVRIINHLERVTEGWLGIGPDVRGEFSGFGR